MKDICGFPIKEGFYEDTRGVPLYYQVEKGSNGFMKRESVHEKYSTLDSIFASNLTRVSDKLVKFINSIQSEQRHP